METVLGMAAHANCGYTALQTRGSATAPAVNGIGGLVAAGGRVYCVSTTGQVLCMEIAGRAPCAGQPIASVTGPGNDNPGAQGYYGAMTVVDGKVFISASEVNGTVVGPPARLGCFDPATTSACDGWPDPKGVGPANHGPVTWAVYPRLAAGGGVCTTLIVSGGASSTLTECFTTAGVGATPPNFSLQPPPSATPHVFNSTSITGPDGHPRSYFPSFAAGGGTICWDWTTAAACTGFPTYATHGVTTRDYGYAYDTTTRCLIGLGDAEVLFSEDPLTGASLFVHSGASASLAPGGFSCDGAAHASTYSRARLEGIDAVTSTWPRRR